MTLPELKKKLDTLGLPVVYHHWAVGQAPPLPYLIYYDDIVYSDGYAVTIEIYSQKKDLALETKVKNLLNENQSPYHSYEDFLDTEDMYLKAYEINI